MKEKSIAIIGAGIAGLAAGCYARMNGYQARILELHDKPGGLCTAWRRGDYTFDGCVHWLVGSSPANGFHRVWRELGALAGPPAIDHDVFMVIEDEAGRAFKVYRDADRLGAHLAELSPADRSCSAELVAAIKKFTSLNFSFERQNIFRTLGTGIVFLALAPLFQKYGSITLAELGAQFQDPLLRDALQNAFGYPEFPALAFVMTMAYQHAGSAGFPRGGSLPFARAIEKRFLNLGGAIEYRARVRRILVENDRARGVELEDGRTFPADIVVSAADGHATIFDLLGGRYAPEEVKRYYDELPIFRPVIQVSLGVNRDLSQEPRALSWRLEESFVLAGEERTRMGCTHYSFDPSFAPKGKSAVVCLLPSDFEYWKKLKDSGDEAYRAEKEKVLQAVLDQLEKRLPGLRAQVEVSDVATPLTFHRYTNNWQGSMEGWRLTRETMRFMINGMKMTLPGLNDFYMIGQWVKPGGGLPPAAQSGREAVAEICRRDRKKFKTFLA